MSAKEVAIIQKLNELRRAAGLEGQRKGNWANGTGALSERDAYNQAKAATDTAYDALLALMVTE